ncbi:MAG: tetratricopeptide repeat protein [Candidatus Obscuribacterales bacterium]
MSTWKELHDRGYALATDGDAEGAEEFLLKAIDLASREGMNDELCDSLNCLAVIYHLTDRLDDAKALFQRTIDVNPDSEELGAAYDGLATILCQEDRYDEALDLYATALSECRKHDSTAGVLEVECKLLALMDLLGDFGESEVAAETVEQVREKACQALKFLDLKKDADAEEIIETLDSHIDGLQQELAASPERLVAEENALAERAVLLGSLWGETLAKQFGWHWTFVEIGSSRILTIVSPDRALAIYPCQFISSCLLDADQDCTILLAYNMMKDGLGDVPANGFENVMEGVFRMFPEEAASKP